MAGRPTEKPMQALSALSSFNFVSKLASSLAPNTSSVSSVIPTHTQSTTTMIRNDNPFLEPPARKLYKHGHESSSTTNTGYQPFKHPIGNQAPHKKPQRLILTRVLPSNTTARIAIKSTTESEPPSTVASNTTRAVPTTAVATVTSSSIPPTIINSVTSTVTLNPSITEYTGDSQRSSTTPKAPPNREYYDFIMKGLKVDMNLEERLDGEDQAMLAQNSIHDQQQHQDDQQQRQSTTIEEDIPVNSAIMAFARKSIMQHASSSPKTIFRKLSSNRPTGSSSNVQSTSNIINSRTKPSSALTKVDENRNMNGIKRSISAMEQSFKFVSRPELAIPAANDPKKIATMTPPSSDATKNNGSDTQSPALSTTAFSRSALDFSQPLAPRVSKMGSCNTVASKIMPVVKDTEPQQHSTIVTPVSQLRTPPSGSDVSLPSEVDTEMLPAYTMAPSNTNGLIAFDLRSALRIDSARVQYQLPSLIASLSPPTSPKRRSSPYSIPSTQERDALRLRRMPRFKARPLNPKVFTSAGDLGVPRIQKRPLTVPVSPEFSKRKTRSVVAESDLKAKEVVNGAAAMRLKNMVRTEKAAVSHSRPSDIHKLSQPTIPERNNLQTIGAGVQTTMFGRKGVAATAAIRMSATPVTLSGFNPLVVPSVDQTRTKTHLCSITGPPRREEGPSTPPIPKAPILTTTTSRSKSRSKSQPGPPMSKLRRPVTRPVPFAFATSELQRRRMLFEPTISKPTEAATSSAAAPVSPIISTVLTASTAARFTSSASALRLEDL